MEDSWFPDKKERMAHHIREKPFILKEQFEDGADAVFTSIQMPDKWLHAIGEGTASEQWVQSEAPVLDKRVEQLVAYCEAEGISWMFFGDHGSPHPGAMKVNGYILPRHRKESIILSLEDIDPPTYTDEMYDCMKQHYSVESVDGDWSREYEPEDAAIQTAVEDRLENLGYL